MKLKISILINKRGDKSTDENDDNKRNNNKADFFYGVHYFWLHSIISNNASKQLTVLSAPWFMLGPVGINPS